MAYVGNVGRHLFETLNRNQAVPGPGDVDPRRPFYNPFGLSQGIYQYCNCDTSSYNALQTKIQKQFSRGVDFLLTYTWGKALDNIRGRGNAPSNLYARAATIRTGLLGPHANGDVDLTRTFPWAAIATGSSATTPSPTPFWGIGV